MCASFQWGVVGLVVFDASLAVAAINNRFCELIGCTSLDSGACDSMPAVVANGPVLDAATAQIVLRTCRTAVANPGIVVHALLCPHAKPRTLSYTASLIGPDTWLGIMEDVTVYRDNATRAIEGMMRDPLTGLANRQLFADRAAEALEADAGGCVVMLVDLDRFKAVNDTLGHPTGDALLCLVADRLRGLMRAQDLIARLGGDEFAVLICAQAGQETTIGLASRMVELLGRPYLIEGVVVTIGASVGIALAGPAGQPYDALLKNADLALYHAKSSGRGTYTFFDEAMAARAHARRTLEFDLRGAMLRDEFELYYQPQIHLATGRLEGFEALMRWQHPTRGTVAPLAFIPLAEEIGLIAQLGEWVVQEACRQAVGWPDGLSVAVNVSPHQFEDAANLIAVIETALARSGLPGHRLEVEVTESVLLRHDAAVLNTLHRLRALGVRVAMDDFGTGYSSLSQLQSFPFDKIKIDRTFVAGSGNPRSQHAVISAIAQLGHGLGMTTIAEGVETLEQLERVRAGGCTSVQGFLFSRPVPRGEVQRLIDTLGRESDYAGQSPAGRAADQMRASAKMRLASPCQAVR